METCGCYSIGLTANQGMSTVAYCLKSSINKGVSANPASIIRPITSIAIIK